MAFLGAPGPQGRAESFALPRAWDLFRGLARAGSKGQGRGSAGRGGKGKRRIVGGVGGEHTWREWWKERGVQRRETPGTGRARERGGDRATGMGRQEGQEHREEEKDRDIKKQRRVKR